MTIRSGNWNLHTCLRDNELQQYKACYRLTVNYIINKRKVYSGRSEVPPAPNEMKPLDSCISGVVAFTSKGLHEAVPLWSGRPCVKYRRLNAS